jgi:hypothetical protein
MAAGEEFRGECRNSPFLLPSCQRTGLGLETVDQAGQRLSLGRGENGQEARFEGQRLWNYGLVDGTPIAGEFQKLLAPVVAVRSARDEIPLLQGSDSARHG